jgi:hypothetical protein
MEHDLCMRLFEHADFINAGPELDCCFYHLWHPRIEGRANNTWRPGEEIVEGIRRGEYQNPEDWGLNSLKIEEVRR